MSSFIYPNSETRKMFGKAGDRLAKQRKYYNSVLEKERTEMLAKQRQIQSELIAEQSKSLWTRIKEFFKAMMKKIFKP